MVKINWTDSAIEDLNDIAEYILKDSRRYAELTVNRLFNSVSILTKHPKSGKINTEFQHDSLRELIRGSYRIVYRIIDKFRIDIITVHNSARILKNTADFSEFE